MRRLESRNEFARRSLLAHIVVRPRFQALHDIRFFVQDRPENYINVPWIILRADPPAYFESLQTAHVAIQDHERRECGLQALERALTAEGGFCPIARSLDLVL